MTQEEKDLLLKDLCARLPYGVKINLHNNIFEIYFVEKQDLHNVYVGLKENDEQVSQQTNILNIKPYLRPMSSMTEEEKVEYEKFFLSYSRSLHDFNVPSYIDWLNKKMFDYRGLIEKGLALEAPEGMYKSLIMEQEKSIPKIYVEQFKEKFGEKEIKLEHPVTTIEDYRADPFSSGSSGHITKVRLKGDTLEFYHSWWSYGWYSYDKLYKDYPSAVEWAINQVLS